MTDDARPSPDALLREAAREGRGALKIFLGAAPGVGKTFEMLREGAEKLAAGRDVVIGVVETHGRAETEALVAPLPVVPRREMDYRGQRLTEMDLDAILERRPEIALVDELAHTNAPGSRHPKRWQDIAELLAAGIDVMTTVNVQHVESLNDVVGSITHVRVRETVPDHVFEGAEIELIDLPPEDLIERLRAGKVYVPDTAKQALDHFFSKGNLLALRELALRHAAQVVDARMREHQDVTGGSGYAGGQRVLVGLSEAGGGEQVVRAAKRLADALHAPLVALHVETPRAARFSDAERTRLARTLSLAASLGARLQSVPATSVQEAILAQCRETRATQLVIGKSRRRKGLLGRPDRIVAGLLDRTAGVAVHVIPLTGEARPRPWRALLPGGDLRGDAFALASVGALTLAAHLAQGWIGRGPIDLLYLVPVIASASLHGFRAGLVAALAAGVAYNFFFLAPFYTFIIYNPVNVITAVLLVVVALITGHLAARARAAAALAMRSARDNAALARLATRLGAAHAREDTARILCEEARALLTAQAVVLHRGEDGAEVTAASGQSSPALGPTDRAAAGWALERGEPAGRGTGTLTGSDWQFRPLRTSLGTLAVLGLRAPPGRDPIPPERAALAESLIDQAALAHERLRLEDDMRRVEGARQRDDLRAALLASLSHDLRTPLTAVTAAAEALTAEGPDAALVETVRAEARRLNRFLSNLLDLTRIEEGAVTPDLTPTDLTDVVAAALADLARPLAGRDVRSRVDPDLPLVRADAVLLHHAVLNLIDNAAKYSPSDQPVEVHARMGRRGPVIDVLDRGPGIPRRQEARIFDRFARSEASDRTGGAGLGLAIVKGFAEAQGFAVEAGRRPRGGSRFSIRMPMEAVVHVAPEAAE
ncbi:MAG: ATP-binding protein [Shimia sp.]